MPFSVPTSEGSFKKKSAKNQNNVQYNGESKNDQNQDIGFVQNYKKSIFWKKFCKNVQKKPF